MDVLFQTIARLANGTFHVAKPLRRGHGHHEITDCAECDNKAEAEALNGSSAKTNKESCQKERTRRYTAKDCLIQAGLRSGGVVCPLRITSQSAMTELKRIAHYREESQRQESNHGGFIHRKWNSLH